MNGQIKPEKGYVKALQLFAYFDQLPSPVKSKVDYELIGKLSIPQTEIEHFSGGEQTRLKLAQVFSTYHEGLLIDEGRYTIFYRTFSLLLWCASYC